MSHTRGIKRKHAFFNPEKKLTPLERIMQEIEAERQKKERLEWYLQEVLKEKEALSRLDETTPAVELYLSNCTTSTSTTTSASSSTSSTVGSYTTSSTSSTSSGHPTYVAADFNRWAGDGNTPKAAGEPEAPVTEAAPALESCGRCGRQYLDSHKTCRCRNFESVKKRQRCLSRFVRTGHMVEVVADNTTIPSNTFELPGFNFVDPSFNAAATAVVSSFSIERKESFSHLTEEDFLRLILDEAGAVETFGLADSTATASRKVDQPLGEKSQRRRRASFVGKEGWDLSSIDEGASFSTTPGMAVFGY